MKHKEQIPPTKCTRCGSDDLDTKEIARGLYTMSEKVFCASCGHSWIERYRLILEEVEEQDDPS